MYAVIKTGGKQYKVAEGDKLRVEKLDGAEGEAVELDQVLLVGDGDDVKVGAPTVAGASVSATIKAQARGEKIQVVKFKRRKDYKRVQGHRQSYTELEITIPSEMVWSKGLMEP